MKSFYSTTLSLILFSSVYAQKDYKKELAEPLIEMVSGEYVIEEFMIIKAKGESKQLHLRSQISQDCIVHRDNFIALTQLLRIIR